MVFILTIDVFKDLHCIFITLISFFLGMLYYEYGSEHFLKNVYFASNFGDKSINNTHNFIGVCQS